MFVSIAQHTANTTFRYLRYLLMSSLVLGYIVTWKDTLRRLNCWFGQKGHRTSRAQLKFDSKSADYFSTVILLKTSIFIVIERWRSVVIAKMGSKIDILTSHACISIIYVKMMEDALDVLIIGSTVICLVTKFAHLLADLIASHKDIIVVYCLVLNEPVLWIIVSFSFICTVRCDPFHLIVALLTIIFLFRFVPPL